MPSSPGRYFAPTLWSPAWKRSRNSCSTCIQQRNGRSLIMWRRLEVEDYDAVMALRQAVLSSLPDPDFYLREDDEHMFVRGHLDVFGESIGYFDGDKLAAYLALTTDLVASAEDVEFASCEPTFNDV